EQAAMFYAESWALVHMLTLDRQYRPNLRRLAEAIQGGDTAAAFRKAYGQSIEQVEQSLLNYLRSPSLNADIFDVQVTPDGDEPRVEPAADLAARLALAELV